MFQQDARRAQRKYMHWHFYTVVYRAPSIHISLKHRSCNTRHLRLLPPMRGHLRSPHADHSSAGKTTHPLQEQREFAPEGDKYFISKSSQDNAIKTYDNMRAKKRQQALQISLKMMTKFLTSKWHHALSITKGTKEQSWNPHLTQPKTTTHCMNGNQITQGGTLTMTHTHARTHIHTRKHTRTHTHT